MSYWEMNEGLAEDMWDGDEIEKMVRMIWGLGMEVREEGGGGGGWWEG